MLNGRKIRARAGNWKKGVFMLKGHVLPDRKEAEISSAKA